MLYTCLYQCRGRDCKQRCFECWAQQTSSLYFGSCNHMFHPFGVGFRALSTLTLYEQHLRILFRMGRYAIFEAQNETVISKFEEPRS